MLTRDPFIGEWIYSIYCVIAMSAGNDAKAKACHARHLKIPATIVMPRNTPLEMLAVVPDLKAIIVPIDGGGVWGSNLAF